jgi:hypothetical protein
MKIIFFIVCSFFCFANSFAQTREDLPLYHREQQRKQQILDFLTKSLQKYEGMQNNYDSVQKIILQDSTQRYNLLQKPKTLQIGSRKMYRQ